MGNKFHKKPHNWRWQRFYKLKNSKVSLEENLMESLNEKEGYNYYAYDGYDEHWDPLRDPFADINQLANAWHCCLICYYESIGMAFEDDICEYNYHRLYENTISLHKTILKAEGADKLLPLHEIYLKELETSIVPGNDIEKKLEKHIRDLNNLEGIMDFNVTKLREAVGDFANLEIIKNSVDSEQGEFIAKWACLLAPFWLKSPKTWKKESGVHILDHIFTLYKTPNILIQQWLTNRGESISFKWICWHIIIGQGGSLKKAAKLFNWNIPNKFQHFLLKTPETQYPMESCIHAEISRLGGNDVDYNRVMSNQELLIDPTEMTYDDAFLSFWRSTVLWLIKNREAISDDESILIIAWAMHKYTEGEREENAPKFSWKGRSLNNVLVQSQEYQTALTKPSWVGYKWNSHYWDWAFYDENEDCWNFKELLNGKQLYLEGKHMRHCVSSYSSRCASGASAIFSLKKNGERAVTLEINVKSTVLVQAMGKRNRLPTEEEKRIIQLWMSTIP